jgi:hypothetical protein
MCDDDVGAQLIRASMLANAPTVTQRSQMNHAVRQVADMWTQIDFIGNPPVDVHVSIKAARGSGIAKGVFKYLAEVVDDRGDGDRQHPCVPASPRHAGLPARDDGGVGGAGQQVDAGNPAMLRTQPRLLLGRPRLWGRHQAMIRSVPNSVDGPACAVS